jgi:transposase
VAVARKHEAPLAQIAKDFGISEATLHNWLRNADVEDGIAPVTTDADDAEIRALKKRMRLLEQAGSILMREQAAGTGSGCTLGDTTASVGGVDSSSRSAGPVSSVVLPQCPRAYVAAPVAPANGLFQVINWAFDQTGELTWGDLRILVADTAMVSQLNHLQRLQSRGVRIGTPAQATRARSFHGMVIAYCPDPTMLAAAESLPGTRGVAAVALHNEHLVQWVAACAPQHLGGEALVVGPQATAPRTTRPTQSLQPSP